MDEPKKVHLFRESQICSLRSDQTRLRGMIRMLTGRINRQQNDRPPVFHRPPRRGVRMGQRGNRRPQLPRVPMQNAPPMPDVVPQDQPAANPRDEWVERMIAAEAIDPPPSPEPQRD